MDKGRPQLHAFGFGHGAKDVQADGFGHVIEKQNPNMPTQRDYRPQRTRLEYPQMKKGGNRAVIQFVMGPPPLPVAAAISLLAGITLYLNWSFFLMMTLRNPFAGRSRSMPPPASGSVPGS
jgi:hypothetical protein